MHLDCLKCAYNISKWRQKRLLSGTNTLYL